MSALKEILDKKKEIDDKKLEIARGVLQLKEEQSILVEKLVQLEESSRFCIDEFDDDTVLMLWERTKERCGFKKAEITYVLRHMPYKCECNLADNIRMLAGWDMHENRWKGLAENTKICWLALRITLKDVIADYRKEELENGTCSTC